jgi:hypothetical protein
MIAAPNKIQGGFKFISLGEDLMDIGHNDMWEKSLTENHTIGFWSRYGFKPSEQRYSR